MANKIAVTFTMGVLAAEFGLTRDVLRRILAEASVAPVGKNSGHPVYRLRDAFRAVQRQQQPEHLSPHGRLALARATLAEDELRIQHGQLCELSDVEREIAALFKLCANAFEIATDVLERDVGLSPAQAEQLERYLDSCREQLYAEVIQREGTNSTRSDQGTVRSSEGGDSHDHARACD